MLFNFTNEIFVYIEIRSFEILRSKKKTTTTTTTTTTEGFFKGVFPTSVENNIGLFEILFD